MTIQAKTITGSVITDKGHMTIKVDAKSIIRYLEYLRKKN